MTRPFARSVSVALVLIVFAAASSCHSSSRESATIDAPPTTQADASSVPGPPAAGPQSRMLTLLRGRTVDLIGMRAVETLTMTTPVEELSDVAADLGAVMRRDGRIEMYRLSTGERLWSQLPYAPCRTFFMAGTHVYANCGERLLSYGRHDGREKILSDGPYVQESIAAGDLVFSNHGDGRVTVFDARDDTRIASKVLPPLSKMTPYGTHLVPRPDARGFCYLGNITSRGIYSPNHEGYTAACVDEKLRPIWSKRLSFGHPPRFGYDLHQFRSAHILLHDGGNDADQHPEQTRNGIVVCWRDGTVTPFDDGTFATIEDAHGDRIVDPTLLKVLAETKNLPMGSEWHPGADAVERVSGDRAFVLIKKNVGGLAGLDLAAKKVLFLVPVTVGYEGLSLEVVAGYPIVRSRADGGYRATIFDPTTGRVLYADTRLE